MADDNHPRAVEAGACERNPSCCIQSYDTKVKEMSKEMFCPYCEMTVRTGKVRWNVLLMSLLLQGWPFYLLFCLLTSGRVCRSCGRRIYRVRGQ